jgi:hypothetical protein
MRRSNRAPVSRAARPARRRHPRVHTVLPAWASRALRRVLCSHMPHYSQRHIPHMHAPSVSLSNHAAKHPVSLTKPSGARVRPRRTPAHTITPTISTSLHNQHTSSTHPAINHLACASSTSRHTHGTGATLPRGQYDPAGHRYLQTHHTTHTVSMSQPINHQCVYTRDHALGVAMLTCRWSGQRRC